MAKIKHVAITCEDPDAVAKFYKEGFDLFEVARNARQIQLSDGDINLTILKWKTNEDADVGPNGENYDGIHHIGFQVDSLEETGAKLTARRSYAVKWPETANPGRPAPRKSGPAPTGRSWTFRSRAGCTSLLWTSTRSNLHWEIEEAMSRGGGRLSLRDLSSNMNGMVSAQAIGKYERGEMMPISSVAIALANALDVSTTYLLSPTVISLESVDFRKFASTRVRERAMVEAAVLDHVDRYLQVEELLDITSSVWEIPHDAPYHAETVEDSELIAARVREERRTQYLKPRPPNSWVCGSPTSSASCWERQINTPCTS